MGRSNGGEDRGLFGAARGRARRATIAAVGLVGLGLAATAGCEQAPVESAPATLTDGALGQAAEAVVTCVKLGRPGPALAEDSYLSVEKPATSYGASAFLIAGASATGQPARFSALLRFDTSGIPATSIVTSAKVTLSQTNNGASTAFVHVVNGAWSEATVTAQSFGGAFAPQPFTSFAAGATATVSFTAVPQVQAWVSAPAQNRGLLIEQDGSPFQLKLKSFEYAVGSQHPVLDVCYKPAPACPAGFADCDGNAANGCEASLASPSSCGACGNVCAAAHGAATCVAGSCGLGACDAGFGNCDGDAANGCEADLTPAPGSGNCGACGVSCPPCAGFIGQACPAGLECVDFAGDNCDPNHFGHDCAGLCVTPSSGTCPSHCNTPSGDTCSPGLLCTGIPLIPGCTTDCSSECIPPTPCQFIGSFSCADFSLICSDDPTDACDGSSDIFCPGLCLPWLPPAVAPVLCGGAGHAGCGGGLLCQDIPCDGCDPAYGGVDCLGACVPAPSPYTACIATCDPGDVVAHGCPAGLLCESGMNGGNPCLPPAACSGIGSFSCPGINDFCADDPTDSCDGSSNPACPGRCMPAFDAGLTLCGGANSLPCPGGSICQDIPCDGCDPQGGDGSCLGSCVSVFFGGF